MSSESPFVALAKAVALFAVTALAEIVGCYLPYLWLRQERSCCCCCLALSRPRFSRGYSPCTPVPGDVGSEAAYERESAANLSPAALAVFCK